MIIISGEKFQLLADVFLGFVEDFKYNPLIKSMTDKHKLIDDIVENYDNPAIVFCYTHRIKDFSCKLCFFMNPFTLITHNSDGNIGKVNVNSKTDIDYKHIIQIVQNKNVKMWYGQNVVITSSKCIPLPIGLANSMWDHSQHDLYKHIQVVKMKSIYMCFSMDTNKEQRGDCYEKLKNKIPCLKMIRSAENVKRLAEYRFAICPEGNGVDTHRLWESLYLKTIPIVLKTPFIQILMNNIDVPLVVLDSWEQLDERKLDYSKYVFDDEYFKWLDFDFYKNKILHP